MEEKDIPTFEGIWDTIQIMNCNPPPPGHSPSPTPAGPARGPTQNQISYQIKFPE